jgi:hypothetical protein
MGFLKSLFTGNKKVAELERKEPQSIDSMDSMSLAQVLDFIKSFKESIPSSFVVGIHKRLNEIALYDHHLDQETRRQAWQVLAALNKDIEKVNANNPGYLQALQAASDFMVSNARFIGVGSLKWLIDEHAVTTEAIMPFVMKPEYGHLVADFLAALGAEPLAQVKDGLVHHLILSRRYGRCTNAVLILHGLAAKGDKATLALFSAGELAVLVGVPDDYTAGRQLLVNLGLLPSESNALPFVPVNDPAHLIGLMREAYNARNTATNDDSRMQMVGESRQDLMQSALAIQRLHLIRRIVGQVHGPDMAKALLDVLSEGAARDVAVKFDSILIKLENASAGTPIDFMLLSQFMEGDGIKLDTDEDFQREAPWMEMCAEWLNEERIEVLDYTRFLLRWDDGHMPPQAKTEADESISDFILQTYLKQGSKAGLAEKTLPYLEDWIGTHA